MAAGTIDTPPRTGHDKHCFVVMPFGRDVAEHRWYRGWYDVVIKQAIADTGFDPILSATQEEPVAINDEIRTHLAFDPMVVVDLGGMDPSDDPNPNVMYELGIRHALGLPLVIMGWKSQRLPFDVNNQRVIMEERDFASLETNRDRLRAFIQAASAGRYYRPMEAVGRFATIEAAAENPSDDSLLGALASEIKDLRDAVTTLAHSRTNTPLRSPRTTLKDVMRNAKYRKDLYLVYAAAGGTPGGWGRLLRTTMPLKDAKHLETWDYEQWRTFVISRAHADVAVAEPLGSELMDHVPDPSVPSELLEKVSGLLPPQPWPPGTHKAIADELGVKPKEVSRCIQELIRRGDVKNQVDGQILD